ncbi:hypothetical protein ADT71_22810 [Novosphingobium sp. ST904]|nr:hypothetical protein ADT71_22810 [Novosphingobium sp. ST904]
MRDESLAGPVMPDRRLEQEQPLQLLAHRLVEADLGYAVHDRGGIARSVVAKLGIDGNQQEVVVRAFPHERDERRVGAVATVPVILALDRHRRKIQRQTCGSEQGVRRQLLIAEDPHRAALGMGCRNEDPRSLFLRYRSEIDMILDDLSEDLLHFTAQFRRGMRHAEITENRTPP